MNYLAIDAGTSNLKMGLFSDNGDLIELADHKTKVLTSGNGTSEMDMALLWEQTTRLFTTIRKRNPEAYAQVGKIAICAQGEGLWAIDQAGQPVRHAILWNDARSLGSPVDWDRIHRQTDYYDTNRLYRGSFPYQLRWLKDNEQASYQRVAHIFHCKDWLNFQLTGVIATDPSDASTAVFNLINKEYMPDLLGLFDVEDKADTLPGIIPSGSVIGPLRDDVAQRINLPNTVQVIMGALDLVAVAYGAGIQMPGQKLSILGTTLANIQVFDEENRPRDTEGSVICHAQDKMFIRQVSALSGTINFRWLKNWSKNTYKAIEAKIKEHRTDVIYLPYLMGERAPFHSSLARGVFVGLTPQSGEIDMWRAVYEGVLFSMKDCLDHMSKSHEPIVVTGGGFQSDFICQLAADINQTEIQRLKEPQLGLLGVFRLMQSNETVLNHKAFKPQEEYKLKYAQYIHLKDTMINYWTT